MSEEIEEYKVFLIGGEEDESGTVSVIESDNRCRLQFRYRKHMLEADASDFFEAFCRIRLELEKEGLLPFCYGASLNVYPSGMARDMARGLRAYKLTMGKHAHDLAEIFEAGPDVIPAYVDKQREFFEEWLNSPRV
jgi:hypothetical protein